VAILIVVALAAFGSSPTAPSPAVVSGSKLVPTGPPKKEPIAAQGDLLLQLPVPQARLTAIGYHGAGDGALPLDPIGRQRNEGIFSRLFHRIFGGGGSGPAWVQLRGGEGPSTGAVDVGAPVGTGVYSPVDGSVVSIRDYILNGGKHGNVVEIQPTSSPSVVVSLSHFAASPRLTVGAPVSASTSRLGRILDFSSYERQALADHTQDAGNHVTITVSPAATSAIR
jgi:hypothetical protein